MGVSVFPAPGGGASEALPLGATAKVASAYAPNGGWKYNTSTAAGTYQLTTQGSDDCIYGIRTANGVQVGNITGNKTVPFKTASTEASITVGSVYPFQKAELSAAVGTIRTVNGGNGLFILITNSGYLYTSTDGLTWTNRTTGFEGVSPSCGVPGYVNDRWVVPGWSNADNGPAILHSTNGITWSRLDLSAYHTSRVQSVGYGDGYFYSLSASGSTTQNLARSTNFSSWSNVTIPTTNNPQAYIYYNHKGTNYHMLGCGGSVVFFSTNGTSWSQTSISGMSSSDISKLISGKSGELIVIAPNLNGNTTNSTMSFLTTVDGTSTPSTFTSMEMNSQLTIPTNAVQGGYLFGMYIIMFSSGITQSLSATTNNSQVGPWKIMFSKDGLSWTIREMPRPHINVQGQPLQDVNGIICYPGNLGQTYYTTAFNSAAFHITSTALANA
jgi:hypothetical protein